MRIQNTRYNQDKQVNAKRRINQDNPNLMKERRKHKNDKTEKWKQKYGQIRNKVNREYLKAQERYIQKNCQEIEVQIMTENHERAYKAKNNFLKQFTKRQM